MEQTGTVDPRTAARQPPFPRQTQEAPGITAQMNPRPDCGEQTYKGLGRLRDRVVLVTGGDSGIGRAVAIACSREGADVVIAYLNEQDDAAETKRFVEDAGRKALLIAGDLADEAHCRRIITEARQRFGRIDVLVNNAAFQGKSVESFEQIDGERLQHTFAVNIIGMFNLTRLAVAVMRPGGSIINVASIQAYQPKASILDYAATKGAIVAFTKGLAQELIDRGIRVNAVAPGPVWTPLIVASFDEEHVEKFGTSSPLGRPAQPVEVAPAFVFLACDESRYVNGEVLGVTGGQILA
jgi:NAD(P)-dependent dehydrogenase (short-subunit alcohol dehydrogenase family)